MENNRDAKYIEKLNYWKAEILTANGARGGVECDAEVVEEGDEITVFSEPAEEAFCQLNLQINRALSSAARKWACEGRGRVSRQAVRRLKKVKSQFDRRYCAEGVDARRRKKRPNKRQPRPDKEFEKFDKIKGDKVM